MLFKKNKKNMKPTKVLKNQLFRNSKPSRKLLISFQIHKRDHGMTNTGPKSSLILKRKIKKKLS